MLASFWLLVLTLETENDSSIYPPLPETKVNFHRLHDTTTQTVALFTQTAVRTSNPANDTAKSINKEINN
jgi:hypothetical protein